MHNPSMAVRGSKNPGVGQLKDPFKKKCYTLIDPFTGAPYQICPGGGRGRGPTDLKDPFGRRGSAWSPSGFVSSAWQPAGFQGGSPVAKQAGFAPATTFLRGAQVQARRGMGVAVASRPAIAAPPGIRRALGRLADRRARAAARVSAAMLNVGIQPGVQRSACKSTKSAAQHGCQGTAFYHTNWKMWCCGAQR